MTTMRDILAMLPAVNQPRQPVDIFSSYRANKAQQAQQAMYEEQARHQKALEAQARINAQETQRSAMAGETQKQQQFKFDRQKEFSKRTKEMADFIGGLDPTDPQQKAVAQHAVDLYRQSVLGGAEGPTPQQPTPGAPLPTTPQGPPRFQTGGPEFQGGEPPPTIPPPSQTNLGAIAQPGPGGLGKPTPGGQEQLARMRAPGELVIGRYAGGRDRITEQPLTPQEQEQIETDMDRAAIEDRAADWLNPQETLEFVPNKASRRGEDELVIGAIPGVPESRIPMGNLSEKEQHLVGEATKLIQAGKYEEATEVITEVTGDPKFALKDMLNAALKRDADKEKKRKRTGTGGKWRGKKFGQHYNTTQNRAAQAFKTYDIEERIESQDFLTDAFSILTEEGEHMGAKHVEVVYSIARARETGRLSDQDYERAQGMIGKAREIVNWLKLQEGNELSKAQRKDLAELVKQMYRRVDGQIRNSLDMFHRAADAAMLPGEAEAYDTFTYENYGRFKWYKPRERTTLTLAPLKKKKPRSVDDILNAEGGK